MVHYRQIKTPAKGKIKAALWLPALASRSGGQVRGVPQPRGESGLQLLPPLARYRACWWQRGSLPSLPPTGSTSSSYRKASVRQICTTDLTVAAQMEFMFCYPRLPERKLEIISCMGLTDKILVLLSTARYSQPGSPCIG